MNIDTPSRPPLALIAGPTASGKSALALAIAEQHGGWVINADSAQVYADLRVLSARPSDAEMARAPHRLFGHVDGRDAYSAARWAEEARLAMAECHAKGGLPVLVGGTGLYLRTLLDGIAPVPDIDPQVRAAARAMPVADAYRTLAVHDPGAAARLAPADTARIARALEVVLATGRTLADWQSARTGGIAGGVTLHPMILLPDRQWLFDRCDERLDAMFDGGARDEVQALLDREDIPESAPVRRAIGVAEIANWIAGRCSRDEALVRAKLATRQYAKRQYTWFRNQPPAAWPRVSVIDMAGRLALFSCLERA